MTARAIAQPMISQAGIPGPAGATGPQGETGPQGPAGPASVWQSYTPTLTQDVTVAATVDWARYTQFGDTVIGSVGLTITGTGTPTEMVALTLPVAASTSNYNIGTATYYVGGEGNDSFPLHVIAGFGPTEMNFQSTADAPIATFLGQTETLGNTQNLYVQFMYEAATP